MAQSSSQIRRIVVAGSKEIMSRSREKIALAEAIGAKVIQQDGWILLTGGALGIRSTAEPTAIDYWAASGAEKEATRLGVDPRDKIRTLHPLTCDHPLHNMGTVEVTKRRTPALRRFDLVAQAQAIVCIEGLTGLTTILELSIALNKILIPIPCTGGTSQEIWEIYEPELLDRLKIQKNSEEYIILTQSVGAPEVLASTVLNILKRLLSPNCYVALPQLPPEDLCKGVIQPILTEMGLQTVTFSGLTTPTSILSAMIDSIRDARLVVADITGNDADVAFQLGVAEALGKSILLICRADPEDGKVLGDFPLGIRSRRVISYRKGELGTLAAEFQKSLKQIIQL